MKYESESAWVMQETKQQLTNKLVQLIKDGYVIRYCGIYHVYRKLYYYSIDYVRSDSKRPELRKSKYYID